MIRKTLIVGRQKLFRITRRMLRMSPVRPRHQRDRSGPVWLRRSRPSLRTRLQRFLERHPRSFGTVITILLGYVSIGTVYRLAQARATVTSGWPEAVVIGVGVTVALLTLIVTGRGQRPHSRRRGWPPQGVLGAFVLGVAGDPPPVFSGWGRTSYRVTPPCPAAGPAPPGRRRPAPPP